MGLIPQHVLKIEPFGSIPHPHVDIVLEVLREGLVNPFALTFASLVLA